MEFEKNFKETYDKITKTVLDGMRQYHLSEKELALKANVTVSNIYKITRKDNVSKVRINNLFKILSVLNMEFNFQ